MSSNASDPAPDNRTDGSGMSMDLPADGWGCYRVLVRQPLARAIDILEDAGDGNALPDLATLADDDIAMLYRLATITELKSGDDHSAKQTAGDVLNRVDAERRRRGLRGLDNPQHTEISKTLEDIRSIAVTTSVPKNPTARSETLARIDGARRDLATVPDGLPPHLDEDAAAIASDLDLLEAQVMAASGDRTGAEAAFTRALDLAERADTVAGDQYYYPRTLLNYCRWAESRDVDDVLTRLLPRAIGALADRTSGQHLDLFAYLVGFYFRAGDRVESRLMMNRLEQDLDRMGFAEPTQDDCLDILSLWVTQAAMHGRNAVRRHQAFHQALLGYITVYSSRINLECIDPKDGMPRLAGLIGFATDAGRHHQAVLEADRAVIERFAPDLAPDLIPDPEIDQSAIALFGVLAEQYAAIGASDALLSAFDALNDHPACDRSLRGHCHLKVGLIQTDLDRPDRAAVAFSLARDVAAEIDDLDLETEARTNLIYPYFQAGKFDDASVACGEAIDRVELVRQRVNATYLRSAFMENKVLPYYLGIVAAEKLENWGLMLARTELLKARAFREEYAEPTAGNTDLVEELTDLSRRAAGQRDEAGRAELLAQRRMVWDRLMLQRKRIRHSFDLNRLQKRLRPGDIILCYFFLASDVLLTCGVSRDRISTAKARIEDNTAFFAALDRVGTARSTTRGLDLDFADLAPVLLPEHVHKMVDQASQLIVCAHQSLHQVPFAALPWQGQRLIHHTAVGMVPNLTCLLVPTASRNDLVDFFGLACRESVDEFGNPLPGLSQVEGEVLGAANAYRNMGGTAEILVGPEVDREALADDDIRSRLATARYLHIGLHGSDVAGEDVTDAPMEAKLYFANGPVDGIDIATWRISADLVVLAACHAGKRAVSARGAARLPADAVWGLQAAFHEAGAGAVFAPLWPANDQTTPHLMAALHDGLARGSSPVAAARQAALYYLKDVNPNWRDPRFWASFVLVGFGPSAFGLSPTEDD